MITIKSKREIELMRNAGRLAAQCLKYLSKMIQPGVTPLEIDKACYDWTIEKKATPAPLNYRGFPNSLCVSVNDVVCHGIPTNRPLQDGDIVNLDVTPILNGYHGDTSKTFFVGQASEEQKKLVEATYISLWEGIKQVHPGAKTGAIGSAIQKFINPLGYSIVIDYCGHGIGKIFHEEPMILHIGDPNQGTLIKEGMTFTIEPMINIGTFKTKLAADNWTVHTADGKLSAQFEHTILVTNEGYEVLTLFEDEKEP